MGRGPVERLGRPPEALRRSCKRDEDARYQHVVQPHNLHQKQGLGQGVGCEVCGVGWVWGAATGLGFEVWT